MIFGSDTKEKCVSFNSGDFMELVEGDKELASTLVSMFADEWRELFSKIEAGVAEDDSKTAEYYAHRLKGNVRNFYAKEATELGQRIEDASRDGRMAEAKDDLPQFRQALEALEQDLSHFVSSL